MDFLRILQAKTRFNNFLWAMRVTMEKSGKKKACFEKASAKNDKI